MPDLNHHFFWHQPLLARFSKQRQQQRMAHAILLSGEAGLGKTTLSGRLAAGILCSQPQSDSLPCGNCHSCQLMQADTHPDHLLIEPEEAGKTIKIAQIRELINKQTLTPNVSAHKTVIIHPAHQMTNSAANSLLKLLEEPPAETFLFLVSSRPHVLPATIKSRCQQWHMNTPETRATQQWLRESGINLPEKHASRLLELAYGAPLRVAELAEKPQIVEMLEHLEQDFTALMQQQANPVEMASRWQNYDVTLVLHYWQRLLTRQIRDHYTNDKFPQSIENWALIDCIQDCLKLISSQNNFNKTLLLEDFMVSVMQRRSHSRRLSQEETM